MDRQHARSRARDPPRELTELVATVNGVRSMSASVVDRRGQVRYFAAPGAAAPAARNRTAAGSGTGVCSAHTQRGMVERR